MAPLLASLELFERAGMQRLRDKSRLLTSFLAKGIVQSQLPITLLTPNDAEARGCQLSLALNVNGAVSKRMHEQLSHAGIISDWREPNVLRIAPTPFYNTYTDAGMLLKSLAGIIA